jgi:membrane protein YqaA with SNARE-associated domain
MSFLTSLSHWLIETLEPYGAPGLMLIAIGDSSFLSLPEVNDAALMAMSINNPYRMWELAAMTVLGSVIGCSLLYALGRRGGEALLRRRFAAEKVQKVQGWYQKYGMLAVIVPSLLPPPLPFKIFVLCAGAFQIPWTRFVLSVAIGRSIRYFAEGLLAVWYGKQAVQIVADNFAIAGVVLAALIVVGAVLWILLRRRKVSATMVLLPLLFFVLSGCVKTLNVPPNQRIAKSYPFSEEQAMQKLGTMSNGVQNLRASIQVDASTASVKEENKRKLYPPFSATLMIKRAGGFFLKGRKFPVDLFEMKSDGTNYQFYVDPTNQLYVGTEDAPPSKPFSHLDELVNQFVNLRPKQLQDALMIDVLPLLSNTSVIPFGTYQIEQETTEQKRYFLLHFLDTSPPKPYLAGIVWFDLSTETVDVVRRETYGRSGRIESDARYSDYQFVSGGLRLPMHIEVQFPVTETNLGITFLDPTGVAVNTDVPPDAFVLDSHPGAKVYKFEPQDADSVTQQR